MKAVFTILLVAAFAGGAWWLANTIDRRNVSTVEWALAGLAIAAAAARWRAVAKRRQRQKLQELRDSALW